MEFNELDDLGRRKPQALGMGGLEGEHRGAPGRFINRINALSRVTVPKISVILRESCGQAYRKMGGGRSSDEVIRGPTADLGFLAPEVGVRAVYGVKKEDDPERFQGLREKRSRECRISLLGVPRERHRREAAVYRLNVWPPSD